MRYGRHFTLDRLTPVGQNILAVLIARELTSPSRGQRTLHTFLGMDPDHPDIVMVARRIAVYPENGLEVSIRADCIHAAFGVLEFISSGGLTSVPSMRDLHDMQAAERRS